MSKKPVLTKMLVARSGDKAIMISYDHTEPKAKGRALEQLMRLDWLLYDLQDVELTK